jgi:hypothetical protein
MRVNISFVRCGRPELQAIIDSLHEHRFVAAEEANLMRVVRTPVVTGRAIVGLAAALSIVACSTGATGGVASAPATGSATTASAGIPTPQPTEPFAIKEGKLAPGRYLQAGFPPGISFVLPDGWQAYFDDGDSAYLSGPQGVEIGINKPPQIVDPKTFRGADSPADLAAWLAASPAFDTAKSSSVTVGGLPATLVEATSTGTEMGLFAYSSGDFHTVAGSRYAFYVFPREGPDLVFMLIGPKTAFEANLPMLKKIVDSIKVQAG